LKKSTFIKNAFIMTATALLLRTIGMFFRVYMSNKIGAEGMGLYQLIFSIYVLGSTFATSGICTAVTRLVTDELVTGTKKSVNAVLRKAIVLSVLIGVASALLIFFGADPISRYYEYNKRYQVLLSPWKFEEIAASAAIRLERGGVKALTVEDIAYQANSDFNRERQAEPAIAVAKSRAALESLAADFDLSVQYGGFHTLGIAEKIWNIPDTSSRFAVEDESVPFYQMVIHGYIPYCLPPVNDAADSREALLRSVEYGAELQYALVYRNVEKPVDNADRFYNKLYTHYVEEIPAFYAESRAVLSAVSNQCMVKRENVNANAVAITYENGAVAVVNYAPDALTYENREIPGRSFALLDAAA